ncbi:MAG TPA: hypothetical protein V6D15_05840 [Oculatellaceae cyanobacterium]|jgi:hypothetical protein
MLLVGTAAANLLSFTFWFPAHTALFRWFDITMVRAWVQAETLLMDSLLDGHCFRLAVEPPFTPALRIDGKSLP